MRALLPALALPLALALAAPLATSEAAALDDAYEVSGHHAIFGQVSGYLFVERSTLAELWLSGPILLSYHAAFTFDCDSRGSSTVVVEECAGSNGARFAGAYLVDEAGGPAGPATGAGQMFGFRLLAHGHT